MILAAIQKICSLMKNQCISKIVNSAEPWESKTLWRDKLNHKSYLSQNNWGETGHGEGKGRDRMPHSNIVKRGFQRGWFNLSRCVDRLIVEEDVRGFLFLKLQ